LYSCICLLVSIIICKVSEAKPTYYDLDSYEAYDTDRYDSSSYALTYGKPLTDNRLKKLNPGYYYVDDGYIAPVAASAGYTRREDGISESGALPHNLLTMFWVCKKIFTPSWVAWKKVKLWKTTEFVVIAPSTASRLGFIFI